MQTTIGVLPRLAAGPAIALACGKCPDRHSPAKLSWLLIAPELVGPFLTYFAGVNHETNLQRTKQKININ
jgi:hypothetical protein